MTQNHTAIENYSFICIRFGFSPTFFVLFCKLHQTQTSIPKTPIDTTEFASTPSQMSNFHEMGAINRLAIVILFIGSFIISHNSALANLALASAEEVGGDPSAYEILKSYDFPMGLLPKGAIGHDLDEKTGKFNAYFNASCSFSLEGSYQLRYKSKISGYIAKGKLSQLSGISVKVLFLWLNIVEVIRDGDDLVFSVGIASADFPIDNFDVIPQCGCGLNCNGIQAEKILRGPSLVSSI